MPRRRDPDSGQYTTVYSEEDVLAAIGDSRLGTSEVADELDCHRTTAHEILREMEVVGLVSSKKVGNTLLWETESE